MTGRQGGSGLGLTLARQTFERHGARLYIRSIRGSGTLISLRLPSFYAVQKLRAVSAVHA